MTVGLMYVFHKFPLSYSPLKDIAARRVSGIISISILLTSSRRFIATALRDCTFNGEAFWEMGNHKMTRNLPRCICIRIGQLSCSREFMWSITLTSPKCPIKITCAHMEDMSTELMVCSRFYKIMIPKCVSIVKCPSSLLTSYAYFINLWWDTLLSFPKANAVESTNAEVSTYYLTVVRIG